MVNPLLSLSMLAVSLSTASCAPAQEEAARLAKVRDDRKMLLSDTGWIYNDLPKGIATAKKSGKPMLILFRCLP